MTTIQQVAQKMQQVLSAAVGRMIGAEPVAIPTPGVQRFNGVYILDASTIRLPVGDAALLPALADEWAGCGNRVRGNEAGAKVQVCLDLSTGALRGPSAARAKWLTSHARRRAS